MPKLTRLTASLALLALAAVPAFTPAFAAQSTSMTPPGQNLMGKAVYNDKGARIGTVKAITSDTQGQTLAGVEMMPGHGLDGATVLFPHGSLTPRADGGFTTSLTEDAMKQLPKTATAAR